MTAPVPPTPVVTPELLAWWTAYRTGGEIPPARDAVEEAARQAVLQRWEARQAPAPVQVSKPDPNRVRTAFPSVNPKLASFLDAMRGDQSTMAPSSAVESAMQQDALRKIHQWQMNMGAPEPEGQRLAERRGLLQDYLAQRGGVQGGLIRP